MTKAYRKTDRGFDSDPAHTHAGGAGGRASGERHRGHAGDAFARHPRPEPGQDLGGYRQLTPERAGPGLAALAADFLQDIRQAQNLLVLKTRPPRQHIAVAIDHENWADIVGTLAATTRCC